MFQNAPKKEEYETKNQYFYKLCSQKEELGYTWEDIRDIMNEIFDNDFTESKYRKDWVAFVHIFNENKDRLVNYSLKDQIEEENRIFKAKKELCDQRREFRKGLTRDARFNNLIEHLISSVESLPMLEIPFKEGAKDFKENKEALLLLSDWHYGQTSNNVWNRYNVDICKKRVADLFEKVSKILSEQKTKTLHIALLGDFVNGAIHVTSRVMSEENVCDQIVHVSEILSEFINFISFFVEDVYVYSTYGNHARIIPNKEDSIHEENFEKLIPWWLAQRLKSNKKIHIIDNDYYEFLSFSVCNKNIVCTHGDLDKFQDLGATVNNLFSKKFNKCVDYTFSGDKHHQESFEQFGIESTLVGSLCGTDEFANNKRLYSDPSQTLCIFTADDGKECTYNIKL